MLLAIPPSEMCVRYTLHKPESAIKSIGHTLRKPLVVPPWLEPRYNLTVTHAAPVVVRRGPEIELAQMTWGLLAYDGKTRLPNAKIETVRTLKTFSKAFATRRCLVPANGFYEWKHEGRERRPHLFEPATADTLYLAGIHTEAEDGETPDFTILTTTPNATVAALHNRMPVLLNDDTVELWLKAGELSLEEERRLAVPASEGFLTVREVDPWMGNPRNEGPRCHAAPPARDEQLGLF